LVGDARDFTDGGPCFVAGGRDGLSRS